MSHSHSHGHHHGSSFSVGSINMAFLIGIILNVVFIIVEVTYGFIANSSALLADAGHNASDVMSLGFAWAAMWLATKKPKGKYTYGFRRTTILVSLLNAILIFIAVLIIGYEAIDKLRHPSPVSGNTIMIVAAIGIVINGITALLFMKDQKHDLNIKGAFLHMIADAAVSLGVVIGGLLIKTTHDYWIDPLISFLIIITIIWATWRLFIDSVNLALDAVPSAIDLEDVRKFLLSVEGVKSVHDLHIWAMSTTQIALTTHLVIPDGNDDKLLKHIRKELHDRFSIEHTTIQVEQFSQVAAGEENCGC